MDVNRQLKQGTAFILWLLIVPALFTLVWKHFPLDRIDLLFTLANFVMLLAASRISFKLFSITVSVERWLIFVIFLQYGLWAEMMFMQLALVLLQLTQKSSLPPLYRFSTNSLMFVLVSVASAAAFYFAGGQSGAIGQLPVWHFAWAALVYALTYSVTNALILFLMMKIEQEDLSGLLKVSLWDIATSLFFMPLAIAYSLLTDVIGGRSVLLLGVPFLLTLFIIRKYAFTGELNEKLSSAVEVGHELSESLSTGQIIETFMTKMQDVVNYDQLYLLDAAERKYLKLLSCVEAGQSASEAQFFTYDTGALGRMEPERIVVYSTAKEVAQLSHLQFSPAVQSVLTAPIIRGGTVEGYLLMTSFRRNFFNTLDCRMVELLAGYFETSIVKAFHYERTVSKSERCGLTGLHNYRFLSRQLGTEMGRWQSGGIDGLSAIILDIDHFKSINDTYGHQSGNRVLTQFADILRTFATEGRTLARFGGEEFVLLLPGTGKTEAAQLAEQIRRRIESAIFEIEPDLQADRDTICGLHLTASLGVSSIPDDTESEASLLRNADRALYIGGKQAGRNRVGVYEPEESRPLEI